RRERAGRPRERRAGPVDHHGGRRAGAHRARGRGSVATHEGVDGPERLAAEAERDDQRQHERCDEAASARPRVPGGHESARRYTENVAPWHTSGASAPMASAAGRVTSSVPGVLPTCGGTVHPAPPFVWSV